MFNINHQRKANTLSMRYYYTPASMIKIRMGSKAGDLAQWIKALGIKTGGLGFIPEAPRVEGEC